jgi:hypothetical protein
MLPRVRELEESFGDAVVAIGVHAGKYHRERGTEAVADACRREGVSYPIVNDRQFRFWRANSVAAWPTITIVDPEGYVVAQQSGELPYAPLHDFVHDLIEEHEEKGTMDRTVWGLRQDPIDRDTGALRYPGKVAADIEGRIAVSDTGHHRVLFGHMLGSSLEVRAVVGSGEPGFLDGPLKEARFREPQGLALAGDMLIVADRGNHAIRMVDLATGRVATMAGTGRLGEGSVTSGDPLATELRSPWDVLLHDYGLFIAMAGSHQIWRLDLREGRIAPHAGSGREDIVDGIAQAAALAQPMALATDGERLFFADAETSSVRVTSFEPGADVTTLVGTGLFEFGDRDGVGDEVRLQHAAGLAWGPGNHRLWIADTYNHKLKTLDPATRRVEAVEPFEETLAEPMGLATAGHYMLVADTNNHRILRVDQIDKRVVELDVEGFAGRS